MDKTVESEIEAGILGTGFRIYGAARLQNDSP